MTKIAFYDTECFPNFWLLKIKPKDGKFITFSLKCGVGFSTTERGKIIEILQSYCLISFNGLGYDQWMISKALEGATPFELKQLNDAIIVGKERPWKLVTSRFELSDHIDIMEVCPGVGSLKQYAGRIHCHRIQDLPYPPDHALSATMIQEVDRYCENDIECLESLYNECLPLIKLREELSKKHGIDLRSKSDPQIAEAVLKKYCNVYSAYPFVEYGKGFKYHPPAYIKPGGILQKFTNAIFKIGYNGAIEMPEELKKLEVNGYKLGIGGLHSTAKCDSHRGGTILDIDVVSYYPSLIINSRQFPTTLGPTFIFEYALMMANRLEAIARGDETEADAGKIFLNGVFGKLGSPYSILYAPEMLIQTTLTGQLSLLMLIEMIDGTVLSANTDGITVMIESDALENLNSTVAAWERTTGLKTKITEYRSIHSRDVNNYFAVKQDGSVKRKGEYALSGLMAKKNPESEICSDAVAAYLSHGTSIEATIFDCTDIRKFVTVQKVTGGAVKMWGEGPRKGATIKQMTPTIEAGGWKPVKRGTWRKDDIECPTVEAYAQCFAPQTPEYLGKTARWYYATNAPGPIMYATRNATVPLSHGARPCMILPETLPQDIDYNWYVNKAYSILSEIGE